MRSSRSRKCRGPPVLAVPLGLALNSCSRDGRAMRTYVSTTHGPLRDDSLLPAKEVVTSDGNFDVRLYFLLNVNACIKIKQLYIVTKSILCRYKVINVNSMFGWEFEDFSIYRLSVNTVIEK